MDISRELRLQHRVSDEQFDRWILAYLRHAPLSLSIRELNRLIAMQALRRTRPKSNGPILDVGCGDGFWWTQLETDGQQIFGIDVSEGEVAHAAEHIRAALCDVSRERPFPGQRFSEIVGNCSLEHVRDIYAALSNIRAAAAEDARLVLFVPARDWAYQGITQRTLLRHAPRLAMLL